MASNQVMLLLLLLLLCGEIWSSLCAAAPRTATSPGAHKALLYQLQATGPSSHQSDQSPLAVTEPQDFPGEEEAGDGSWVAAVLLGSILIGMILAMLIILLWKCCMRPTLAESHWAGRSPFVDGDTPDLLMDSEQGTKRSSVLFMLPWRLKQGTTLQEELRGSENPPHTTSTENGQPALGCSPAPIPAPIPAPAPASSAADSCPAPDTAPECCDLPPPPEWLREPPEQPSSDPSEHSALHLQTEEPLPPAPEPLIQDIHGTLPQPEHPL